MPDPFCRTLPDELTITVDGTLTLDADSTERAPARVVLTMPDHVADSLAHLLAYLSRLADVFHGLDESGIDCAELAEALYAAATTGGDYRCPEGGLRLAVPA